MKTRLSANQSARTIFSIYYHVFIFVEMFRFVGEQIDFEVLVFGPAGPDIELGRCAQYFGFPNFLLVLESPDFII